MAVRVQIGPEKFETCPAEVAAKGSKAVQKWVEETAKKSDAAWLKSEKEKANPKKPAAKGAEK